MCASVVNRPQKVGKLARIAAQPPPKLTKRSMATLDFILSDLPEASACRAKCPLRLGQQITSYPSENSTSPRFRPERALKPRSILLCLRLHLALPLLRPFFLSPLRQVGLPLLLPRRFPFLHPGRSFSPLPFALLLLLLLPLQRLLQ